MKTPFYMTANYEKSNGQYFANIKIKKWAVPLLFALVLFKMLFIPAYRRKIFTNA